MRLRVERAVKRYQRSAKLEAVACEFELVHGVNVLDGELDAGPLRRLHQPQEKILLLPRLQVYAVVA